MSTESRARQKSKSLWQTGALFHVTSRYPRKPTGPRIDRLAGILKNGLVAPAKCRDGSVRSDLNVLVTGASVPYDSLVFLHRYGPKSFIYTICDPGRFAVFVDASHPVLTPEDMGPHWVELCMDEVYVRDGVGLEKVIGIAIHPADADSIIGEFHAEFGCLEIPLYDYAGNVLWPVKKPAKTSRAKT
jgi:hypothetical protein